MYQAPDSRGFFGEHGGVYVAETLIPALQQLAQAYEKAKHDPQFWAEFCLIMLGDLVLFIMPSD